MLTIAIALLMLISTSTTTALAMETEESNEPKYSIEIEEDTLLENATLLNTDSYIVDGRLTTVKTYELPDGTKVIDTLTVSAFRPYSANGTDTATRTREISSWGKITLTASFQWYTEGLFSYVKCTRMSASRSLNAGAVASTWETSYTKDYVSIGKASAQVKYYFYNSQFPVQYTDGTFKITCTDSGTITDNN